MSCVRILVSWPLAFAAVGCSACFAQGVALPDPSRLIPGNQTVQSALATGIQSGSPAPESARAMAQRAIDALDGLAERTKNGDAKVAALSQKLSDLEAQRAELPRKRTAEIEELRRGKKVLVDSWLHSYCAYGTRHSLTKNYHPGSASPDQLAQVAKASATDAEFSDLIKRWDALPWSRCEGLTYVDGVYPPATPAQIAQKEKEYDQREADLINQIRVTTQERDNLSAETGAGKRQIQEGLALWTTAVHWEPALLREQESAAERREHEDMRQLQSQATRLEPEQASALAQRPPDTARIQSVNSALSTLNQVGQKLVSASRERYAGYQSALEGATTIASREYVRASSYVALAAFGGPYAAMSDQSMLNDPSAFSIGHSGDKFRFGTVSGSDTPDPVLRSFLDKARPGATVSIPAGPLAARTFGSGSQSTQSAIELPKPPALTSVNRPPAQNAPPSRQSAPRSTVTELPLPPISSIQSSSAPAPASAPVSSLYPPPIEIASAPAAPSCDGVPVDQSFLRLVASLHDPCTCWAEGHYNVTGNSPNGLYLDASVTAYIADKDDIPSSIGAYLHISNGSTLYDLYFGLSEVINQTVSPSGTQRMLLSIYQTNGRPQPVVLPIRVRYCKL